MTTFEENSFKSKEQATLEERENFVKENYPIDSSVYEIEEILNNGLDGMTVLEKKDSNGQIEGMISYKIDFDHEDNTYLSIGLMLTREESRQEGVMQKLFAEIKQVAEDKNCEYISAITDTQEGEDFLLNNDFEEAEDKVNDRNYLRLDL